jgi:hypothetical protein
LVADGLWETGDFAVTRTLGRGRRECGIHKFLVLFSRIYSDMVGERVFGF